MPSRRQRECLCSEKGDACLLKVSQGFFNIDGVSLEYQQFTPPHSTDLTLVLLHEGLGCVAMWKDFPLQLAQSTGCRVLVYSRAGYGGSDPCSLPRPLSFMHDEGLRVLPQVLTAAEITSAVLIGHSDGASIALINAGGVADQRVQGLILLAPHVFVENLTLASIREAKIAYETTDLRERLARYHGDNVDCAFWGWNQAWLDPDFADWNLEEYLSKIDVPVLLLQGVQDIYGTILQLEKITTQLAQLSKMFLLPDCGHSPFRDQPIESQRLIMAYLRNHFLDE